MARARLEREDLEQERALARWLGEDPELAVRRYTASERRYYGLLVGAHVDVSAVHDWAPAPLPVNPRLHRRPAEGWPSRPGNLRRPAGGWPSDHTPRKRTAEGLERRREASRAWWREHGAEYRGRRRGAALIGGCRAAEERA